MHESVFFQQCEPGEFFRETDFDVAALPYRRLLEINAYTAHELCDHIMP